MSEQRIRVAVLFGGRSGEHPVSCTSAAGVLAHLDRRLFDVTAVGITRSGQWRLLDPDAVPVIAAGRLPEVTGGEPLAPRWDTVSPVLRRLTDGDGHGVIAPPAGGGIDIDVIFPLLHGPFGEDGTIQGLLELAAVPYVGPGVLASAAAMDKQFTKRLVSDAGLPVAPSVVLVGGSTTVAPAQRRALGLPVFVKPARAGSSLGVSRVDAWADLPAAVVRARDHDPKVLVEAAMVGREIECGVLEFPDGRIEASPTAEIRLSGGRFYDFEAKYLEQVAEFAIPSGLPDALEQEVRRAAVTAFRAIGAQGLARVDFFVTDDGTVVLNEINTMPGFTPISMYPQMWQATGMGYGELLTTLIDTALARGTGPR